MLAQSRASRQHRRRRGPGAPAPPRPCLVVQLAACLVQWSTAPRGARVPIVRPCRSLWVAAQRYSCACWARRLWRPTAPHRRHRCPPSPRPALRRHCRRRSFSARFLDHGALRGHAARPSSESSRRLTARLCWYQRKRCSLPRRSRCRWSLPQARRSRRPRCVSTRHQSLQSTQRAAVSAGRDHWGCCAGAEPERGLPAVRRRQGCREDCEEREIPHAL